MQLQNLSLGPCYILLLQDTTAVLLFIDPHLQSTSPYHCQTSVAVTDQSEHFSSQPCQHRRGSAYRFRMRCIQIVAECNTMLRLFLYKLTPMLHSCEHHFQTPSVTDVETGISRSGGCICKIDVIIVQSICINERNAILVITYTQLLFQFRFKLSFIPTYKVGCYFLVKHILFLFIFL